MGRSLVVSRLMARGVFLLVVLGVSVPACRRDYEVLGLEGDPSSDGLSGVGGTLSNGGSAGDLATSASGGGDADGTSSTDSGGASSTGQAAGGDSTTTAAGTSATGGGAGMGGAGAADTTTTAGGASTTTDGAGGTGTAGAGGATSTTSGTTTTSGATSTAGGTGGTGGTGAGGTGGTGGGTTTTAGGTGGTGGTGSTGTAADLASGYWLLDAEDTAGTDWTPSTLVVTSTTPNPDGTTDLTYRLDWFETAAGFGVLLGGEEIGVGNYDPVTSSLILTQTGGFASDSLDVYEAQFDAPSDTLAGFWDTGTPGTFSGVRKLDGTLLPATAAVASSTQNGTSASNTVDADMFTEWSSSNGGTVGETLTLTLAAPASLRGLRLMALPEGNAGIPTRLRISSRDSGGNEVDLSDVVVPSDPMWNPIPLAVDATVAEVHIEITEVTPAGSNRVMVSGVELFGTP